MPFEYDQAAEFDRLPHLSEMAEIALKLLDNDEDGMFLMIEAGRIDHGGHQNNIGRNIHETMEFSKTVRMVMDWAAKRSDTLILLTADHETGGLSVLADNGKGTFPTVTWSTDGHTGVNVPVYARGVNARVIDGLTIDNTDIFNVLRFGQLEPIPEPADSRAPVPAGASR